MKKHAVNAAGDIFEIEIPDCLAIHSVRVRELKARGRSCFSLVGLSIFPATLF